MLLVLTRVSYRVSWKTLAGVIQELGSPYIVVGIRSLPFKPFPFPMRLNLRLIRNSSPVPFDQLHHLTGALHKWLGGNDPDTKGSAFTPFPGWAEAKRRRVRAPPRGATWTLSLHNPGAARRVLDGLLGDDPYTRLVPPSAVALSVACSAPAEVCIRL